MKSVFVNDPFEMLADIFKELFPDKQYEAAYGYRPDDDGDENFGATIFPDSKDYLPTIVLYVETPMEHLPEIFAHELAHVAVGIEHEHDEVWEKAFDDINKEYIRRNTGEVSE